MPKIQREIQRPVFFSVFFSGGSLQFGAIVLLIGAILFQYNLREYLTSVYLYTVHQTEEVDGVVTKFGMNAETEGGSATEYFSDYVAFPKTPDEISDFCFYTPPTTHLKNAKVKIEYPVGFKGFSRIKGTSSYQSNIVFEIITLVCLIIGIWTLLARFLYNNKIVTLLTEGEIGKATLVDMQQAAIQSEDGPISFVCKFEFITVNSTKETFEVTTTEVDEITDDDQEEILYLASNAKVAHLMDNLPAKVNIGEDGVIRKKGNLNSYGKPILPLIAICYMFVQFLNIF